MAWMNGDWGLNSELARRLYHETAALAPIIDFHNHLSAAEIAADEPFENISRLWLAHDHYKWRMMRANGISETYITGHAPDFDKFCAWAATLPHLVGSPLYQWTHLELSRCFGIDRLLDLSSATSIWDQTQSRLRDNPLTPRRWLSQCQVQVLCTTDDPVDDLVHHQACAIGDDTTRVLPTFRPDRVFEINQLADWNQWLDQLGNITLVTIDCLGDLQIALDRRHQSFHDQGCRLSDNGLPICWGLDFQEDQVTKIFRQARLGVNVDPLQAQLFGAWALDYLARLDCQRGWAKQLHLGAWRNVNSRLFAAGGRDRGGDVMGEWLQVNALGAFLDRLDRDQQLPRMIIYNNNRSIIIHWLFC